MSYWGGWRPHIESALCLNLHRMFEAGALREGATTSGGWHWTDGHTGKETASIGYRAALGHTTGTLTLDYTCTDRDTGKRKPVTCTIELVTVPCNYGGHRWYFRCPYTHRRALKLYKWSDIKLFCHREAIRPKPTYASERVSGSDRIMAQRWALRRKMNDNLSDLFSEPSKPKWMRWRTFERYCQRDAELEAREAVCMAPLLRRMGMKLDGLP